MNVLYEIKMFTILKMRDDINMWVFFLVKDRFGV